MDSLTQLLQGLDAKEIERAMQVLQGLKGTRGANGDESVSESTVNTSAEPSGTASEQVADSSHHPSLTPGDPQGYVMAAACSESRAVNSDENASTEITTGMPLDRKNESTESVKTDGVDQDDLPLSGYNVPASKGARKAVRREEKNTKRARKSAKVDDKMPIQNAANTVTGSLSKAAPAEIPKRSAVHKKQPAPLESAHGLASFGFFSSVVKSTADDKNKLFTPFVQDRRVVPKALRFWDKATDASQTPEVIECDDGSVCAAKAVCSQVDTASARGSLRDDEDSSLLHPPFHVNDLGERGASKRFATFADFIEASNHKGDHEGNCDTRTAHNAAHSASGSHAGNVPDETTRVLRRCPCSFHSRVSEPYSGFNNEVVFSGFYAIGYDPCQARPPFFGTHNNQQRGNLTLEELEHLARFPVGEELPQLSNFDYEYDSGDDWDVLDGDEDIAASNSTDSDDNSLNSLDSSDLDFINDDADASDSECELQRTMLEARQRQMNRLRGKDKLVPSFSGPFVGIAIEDHPLRRFDRLDRLVPLDDAYFTSMLELELSGLGGAASVDPTMDGMDSEARRHKAFMEAALKNRRELTEDEIDAMHTIIRANSKITAKMILALLRQQDMCVGVARAEFDRTLKRFYERKHQMLTPREEPWSPTDERLFTRSTRTKPQRRPDAEDKDANSAGDDADDDADGDADQEDEDAAAAVASPVVSDHHANEEVPKAVPEMLTTTLDTALVDRQTRAPSKRSRESVDRERESDTEPTVAVGVPAQL